MNYSFGHDIYPGSQLTESIYWYATHKNNPGEKIGADPEENKENWARIDYNFGAMSLNSLNVIKLDQNSAYYIDINIKDIPWLK